MPSRQKQKAGTRRILRWSSVAVVWLFVIWLFGLAHFLYLIGTAPDHQAHSPVDGIVVLTGDRGRIAAGLEALRQKEGKRLLISGVNANLNPRTILKAIGAEPELVACCIDLGPLAVDTRSNAVEALDWAKRNSYGSVLIITNDYHMPRSLIEFEEHDSELRIEFRAVAAKVGFGVLVLEYLKYLVSLSHSVLN